VFRGFFSGCVLGLLVSGLTLGTASLVGDQPAGGRPPLAPVSEAPVRPEGSGAIVGEGADAVPGGATDPGGAPSPSEAPEVAAPGSGSPLPQADTAVPVAPAAEDLGQGLAAPAPAAPAPEVTAGAETPVLPNPLARAPEPPVAEALVEVPLDPAPPPPSDTPPDQPAPTPEAVVLVEPEAAEAAPVIVEIAPTPAPDAAPEAAASPDAEPAARPQAETESVTDQPVVAQSGTAPTVPEAVAAPAAGADAPQLAGPAVEETPPAAVASPEPEVGAEAPTEPAAPRIALQGDASALPAGTEAVRVIRPGTEAEAPEPEVAEVAVDAALPEDAPALQRFAAGYDNPEAKPVMSIVLIDTGALGEGAVAAVRTVPFPVTVALDALAGDAAARMAAYRAAGIEVMALAGLPEGALPSDVEITLEAAFSALPDSVALLDTGAGGLQSDRAVTEQAMIRLAQDGRGFVTAAQGLNMALRSAEAAEVPAAVIYRDLDAEGQDARVIRRFLDQAAFRARQQSGVVLVGRVRADTLSALSLWGTANRAGQVTLAPVSAILLGVE
jgi:polysaccharide deacetylase 2 family uncharacterized protein YibQ